MLRKGLYEVERVIGKKVVNRRTLYLVRWRDFTSDHDSWEPASSLGNCKLLVKWFNETIRAEPECPPSTTDGQTGLKRSHPISDATTTNTAVKSPPAKKIKLSKVDKSAKDKSEQQTVVESLLKSGETVLQVSGTSSVDNAGMAKARNDSAKSLADGTQKAANVKQKKTENGAKKTEDTPKQKAKQTGTPKQQMASGKQNLNIITAKDAILKKAKKNQKQSGEKTIAKLVKQSAGSAKKKGDAVKQNSVALRNGSPKQQNELSKQKVDQFKLLSLLEAQKQVCDSENDKSSESAKQRGESVKQSVNKGSAKSSSSGNKQSVNTPEKTSEPALVDLTESPNNNVPVYVVPSESIEISDDEEEGVLYTLNPDCDFTRQKTNSSTSTTTTKVKCKDTSSRVVVKDNSSTNSSSNNKSVMSIDNSIPSNKTSQGGTAAKDGGPSTKAGVGKKKRRMSLMDSKKKDGYWIDPSEEPAVRPAVSPPPPAFTSVKDVSGSPDTNHDLSKPFGPDPVSPEASETYLADVPTPFSVTSGTDPVSSLCEDGGDGCRTPLSPGTMSYKLFLQTLPDQLILGHKAGGGKKDKAAGAAKVGGTATTTTSTATATTTNNNNNNNNRSTSFGVHQRSVSTLSSGMGAVERRTSVRTTECAFRYKQIVVKKCFHFTQIWLNTQTEMKNALNPSVMQEIISAMNSAKYDDSHLVLFSGFGPVFCSGTDLHYLMSDDRRLAARQMAERIRELTKTFISFPKPIIAAVSGAAVGLGVSLLLLCDVVYASDKASFHLPYSQLSQTPEGCSSFTLPQTLGLPSANEMLFGGRKITAMEAYQLGLVSQVFWPTLMMQEVIPRAQNMAASSAKALEATKLLIRSHHRTKMELTNETECNLLLERWLSVDCQHAIEAYLAIEKNWNL